jgi:hypothetical protein
VGVAYFGLRSYSTPSCRKPFPTIWKCARECAALAEKLPEKDKSKLLEIAQEWLNLADARAKQLQTNGTMPKPK